MHTRHVFYFLAFLGAVAVAARADDISVIGGRYNVHFKNSDIYRNQNYSDDVAEIVPLSPHDAYIRISLWFFNGHKCDISGIAQWDGASLVYKPALQLPLSKSCVLAIRKLGDRLRLDDDETCKPYYCSMRGSFNGMTFPMSSRRPITYLPRLRESREYQAAITQWHHESPPDQQKHLLSSH
ncbi:hypothetical protein [Gluconobacter aidae]|uniref:Uncharacterized protein n=1 Tax=Gluconobacter aidae TaxID=2662454 RepID=A0A7X1SRH8_9PROT|nr:hypothetical protein [Gluconobacter aidae]MQR99427.1 hypothetical protein [Gluconobacter aidae]